MSFTQSTLLEQRVPRWRSSLVLALFALGFVALLARAFWIQGPGNRHYAEQGRKRHLRVIEQPAMRGRILDRNGRLLAGNLPARAIWAIPEEVPGDLPPARLAGLAALLGLNADELRARLAASHRFVYLKRQAPLDVAARINALDIPGIHQTPETRRHYPEGEAAAQVVGFTGVDGRGQEGVEAWREADLVGQAGYRQVVRDRLGRIVDDTGLFALPRHGSDIRLTIDARLQSMAYTELRDAVAQHKAKAGSAVVLDGRTGDILALANWPGYDPNLPGQRTGPAVRNRALTDVFEPGSTVKPINIALALEAGVVAPNTVIDTGHGAFAFGRFTVRDTSAHGALSVADVLKKSSNIGMIHIMQKLSAERMWEMFHKVGYGQPPDLGFPGAVAGRVRPHRLWRPVEQATMSYGYGLSVSLLQLAQSFTPFVGDGVRVNARLLADAGDGGMRGVEVMSPATARTVRMMLERATEPGGTAGAGRVPGYRIGAKTGTARKQEGRHYSTQRYRTVYVGLAPVSRPRIVVAVMIDEPGGRSKYGGTVAGPVFSRIAGSTLRTLGVPPDLEVRPTVLGAAGGEDPGVD
jgi:cell division protein FtsI (penicillin-binding protein 3)